MHGLITLQEKIDSQSIGSVRWYRDEASVPIPIPLLGPDLIDPRDYADYKEMQMKVIEGRTSQESEQPE